MVVLDPTFVTFPEIWLTFSEANLIFPQQQTFVDSAEDLSNFRSESVSERNLFETYVLT